MDQIAFSALVERCLPPGADPKPLAAIVREASGFEPLALRFDGRRTTAILNSTKTEAIQLASELVIAGHRVWIGLAGVDTRDLERLGVSLSDGFEPCPNLEAAAALLAKDPGRLRTTKSAPPSPPRAPRPFAPAQNGEPTVEASAAATRAPPPDGRPWDVYGGSRSSSLLVYGR